MITAAQSKKIILIGAGCILTASCAALDGPSKTVTQDPYKAALHDSYERVAAQARKKLDLGDAARFTRKAEAAGKGETVPADNPKSRKLGKADAARVGTAYARLNNLDSRVQAAFPIDAAKAQVSFDCWMERLEAGEQNSLCERKWREVITQLECSASCNDRESGDDVIRSYDIAFGFDSAALGRRDLALLEQVVEDMRSTGARSIAVTGYADRSGDSDYNEKLALKRAGAVEDALNKKGLPRSLIKKESKGEAGQAIPTDDDVKLPANRRVTIEIRR